MTYKLADEFQSLQDEVDSLKAEIRHLEDELYEVACERDKLKEQRLEDFKLLQELTRERDSLNKKLIPCDREIEVNKGKITIYAGKVYIR